MSGSSLPPVDRDTITHTVRETIHRLDPNMLAILAMVIVLNGMFFWSLKIDSEFRHQEYVSMMSACLSRGALSGS